MTPNLAAALAVAAVAMAIPLRYAAPGELLQRVKRTLPDELGDPETEYGVGDVVQFPTPDGQGGYAGVVRELAADWVLFDFNHPLAGQPVSFEVQLIGVL